MKIIADDICGRIHDRIMIQCYGYDFHGKIVYYDLSLKVAEEILPIKFVVVHAHNFDP